MATIQSRLSAVGSDELHGVAARFNMRAEEGGLPASRRLVALVRELARQGQEWILYRAENCTTSEVVETVASDDLAWQQGQGAVETGRWDEEHQVIWFSGGRPVDLKGVSLRPDQMPRGTAEGRRHERVPVAVPVMLGGERSGDTTNISYGGAFVRTDRAMAVSQRVIVAFEAGAEKSPIFLAAEVVRTEPGRGAALRFVHANDEQRAEVRRAVRSLLAAA